MKALAKIWCWVVGHDWLVIASFRRGNSAIDDQGRSYVTHHRCARCKHEQSDQWDT